MAKSDSFHTLLRERRLKTFKDASDITGGVDCTGGEGRPVNVVEAIAEGIPKAADDGNFGIAWRRWSVIRGTETVAPSPP